MLIIALNNNQGSDDLNSFSNEIIIFLLWTALMSIVVCIFTFFFIQILKTYNYFGNIIVKKYEIENEMNKMEPYKIRNMMNELQVFKFSSFLTYLILLTGLVSFLLSAVEKKWIYDNFWGILFIYLCFVLSSGLSLKYYNDAVLYSKEYFYKKFDSKTFKQKS